MTRRGDYDVIYKVMLVGESSVGKTSVIKSLMGRRFNPEEFTTIGEFY